MEVEQIKYSVMSGKLEGISSLNTNTTSNKFCQAMAKDKKSICGSCYSWSMLTTFRKNCTPRFEVNSRLLSTSIIDPQDYPSPKSLAVRFNSHGELINLTHLENLFNICEFYSKRTFTLWTKRLNIVNKLMQNRKKPKNLILIYSNPHKQKVVKGELSHYISLPSGFDKVFNVITEADDDASINCHQKCLDCMMCYTLGNKTEQIIERIK